MKAGQAMALEEDGKASPSTDHRNLNRDGDDGINRCPRHPWYKVDRPPKAPCPVCRKLWDRRKK